MSNAAFTESLSDDPAERAIARRVLRILNDQTLERSQRVALVKKAQRDLLQHRVGLDCRTRLAAHAQAAALPKGFRPHSVQLSEGRVQVGAVHRAHAFVWIDAGQAPQGVVPDRRAQVLGRAGAPARAGADRDAIAERRQARR